MRTAARQGVQAPCALCWHRTLHDIVHTIQVRRKDCRDRYDTLQCKTCRTVSLRHSQRFKKATESLISFYPSEKSRWWPEWTLIGEETEAFQGLLAEVYSANEENLHRLTLMGLRASLEQIVISKVGDVGTFTNKLERLKERGYISSIQFDQLQAVYDAGSAAMHRGFDPGEFETGKAFDMVERILGSIFMHEGDVQTLSARVPPRPPRLRPSNI
jgi:hypothetical protein